MKCYVKNCSGSIKMFKFPDNKIIEWCENLRINPKNLKPSARVCVRHFTPDCMGKRMLRIGAMPTLNLGYDGEIKHMSDLVPLKGRHSTRMCCVNGCFSESPPTNFFGLRSEWKDLIKMKNDFNMKQLFICAYHFDRNRIINKYKRLTHGSLPKYRLTGNADIDLVKEDDDDNDSDEAQIDNELVDVNSKMEDDIEDYQDSDVDFMECTSDSQPSSSIQGIGAPDCPSCGDYYLRKYFDFQAKSKKELEILRNKNKAEIKRLNKKIADLKLQKSRSSLTIVIKEIKKVEKNDIQNLTS